MPFYLNKLSIRAPNKDVGLAISGCLMNMELGLSLPNTDGAGFNNFVVA